MKTFTWQSLPIPFLLLRAYSWSQLHKLHIWYDFTIIHLWLSEGNVKRELKFIEYLVCARHIVKPFAYIYVYIHIHIYACYKFLQILIFILTFYIYILLYIIYILSSKPKRRYLKTPLCPCCPCYRLRKLCSIGQQVACRPSVAKLESRFRHNSVHNLFCLIPEVKTGKRKYACGVKQAVHNFNWTLPRHSSHWDNIFSQKIASCAQ